MPERYINGAKIDLSSQQSSILDYLKEKPDGVSVNELLVFVCSSQNKQVLKSNLTVQLARLSRYLSDNGLESIIQIEKENPDISNSKIINIKLNPEITIEPSE